MTTGLERAQAKMKDAGASDAAIDVFTHFYGIVAEGSEGFIGEDTISPLTDPPQLTSVEVDPEVTATPSRRRP